MVDPLWTTTFLSYVLPSLVSSIESSGVSLETDCVFSFHGDNDIQAMLANHECISQLRAMGPVEFHAVGDGADGSRSAIFTAGLNRAISEDCYASLVSPEWIYTPQLFVSFARAIRAERLALFVLGLRVKPDTILPELDSLKASQQGHLLLNARDAVSLAMRHLADAERRLFWNAGESPNWIPQIYFAVRGGGMFAACWHLHPVLIKPSRRLSSSATFQTGAYLDHVIRDQNRIAIVDDSDRGFYIRLREDAPVRASMRAGGPLTIRRCVKWASRYTWGLHRVLFSQLIFVHGGGFSETDAPLERDLAQVISTEIARGVSVTSSTFMFGGGFASNLWLIARRSLSGFKARTGHVVSRIARAVARRAGRAMRESVFFLKMAGTLVRVMLPLYWGLLFCAQKVAQRRDDPMLDTLIGRLLFGRALLSLDRGKLTEAESLVRAANILSPHAEREFYESLVSNLIRLKGEAEAAGRILGSEPPVRGDRSPVVLAAVVWGEEYVFAFLNYTVRTLLSPGNLAGATGHRMYFSIVTDEKSRPLFEDNDAFRRLKEVAHIQFFLFPTALTRVAHYTHPTFDFYRLYGALDHTSIHFARALKAHILFVVADALYADGAVCNLLRYLEQGYYVCMNASLVAKKENILPALDKWIGEDGSIVISSWNLANLCFRHRHDYISQRLMIDSNTNFDKYPRELYFPFDEGLVVHALYQHPWAISAEAIGGEFALDYFIVDLNLVSRVFAGEPTFQRLKVIEDSSEVFIANYAPAGRKFDTTGAPFDADRFIAVHLQSKPIHWHIWQHRQLIRCETGLKSQENPELVAPLLIHRLRQAIN